MTRDRSVQVPGQVSPRSLRTELTLIERVGGPDPRRPVDPRRHPDGDRAALTGLGPQGRGIGHMIIDSQALLATGQIIFGIIIIGLIGLVSDFLFKTANQYLFPWRTA